MKKLVYISSIASPHQIKYCYSLQKYFEAEFWFYDGIGQRQNFWKVDLGKKCRIIKNVFFKKRNRYVTFSHLKMLKIYNPDIIMLGGFSIPANYIAYYWGVLHHKKIIIFTERSRNKKGILRKKSIISYLFKKLYSHIDLLLVSALDAVDQFQNEFGWGNKVIAHQYPTDIDSYLLHPFRQKKMAYNYIFANRLTSIYNPLLALRIFEKICFKYPNSILKMNECGELKNECLDYIKTHKLENNVSFIVGLQKWDDLGKVYKDSDILLLPAKFSNGNYTILEAMASGMGIVISNNVLGIGKIIENNVNGFNCQLSIENFIYYIEKYIEEPKLFEEHANINRRKVYQYSAECTAKKFYDILKAKEII